MKNLMVYINPSKKFAEPQDVLVRIQIDNCYDMGWKKEDVILVTNFDYEYNGIKSIVVGDENFCEVRPKSTKTNSISLLIDMGLTNDLNWLHDLDAYQLNDIEEDSLELEKYDVGLTDYGWKPRWGLGSFFFKNSSRDIFAFLKKSVCERGLIDPSVSSEDESIFGRMMEKNICNVKERCKKINITYNFAIRFIPEVYKIADKPLRVLHFHPDKWRLRDFMYAGVMGKPIMTDRLIKIFNYHGIK